MYPQSMTLTTVDERYSRLGRLGGGGMGEVYLAHDALLGREVALKVLREPHAGSAEFAERFRREARHAAALSHPNIVEVYDAGESADGEPYMAMEHVPGGTLRDQLRRRKTVPPRMAAAVTLQIAEALSVAHHHGVIHRDIKPENVLVTKNGDVKVADFGISKAADVTAVTQTNLVLGSVRYISPEQAMGQSVSPASDLYSLGVVLYEMLTGEVPFQAEGPIAIAMKHLSQEPTPLWQLAPAVPASLDALTLKLLEKDPKRRYSSAEELAEDLKGFLAGEAPLSSTEPVRITRVVGEEHPPPRRRRRSLFVSALIALTVAVPILSIGAAMGLTAPLTQHLTQFPLVAHIFSSKEHQQPFQRALAPSMLAGEEIRAQKTDQPAEKPQGTREVASLQGGSEEAAGFSKAPVKPQHAASTEQKITASQQTEQKVAAPQQEAIPQAPPQPQASEPRAPETVAVPDLTGMTVAQAEIVLADLGLILKVSSYAKSETVPEGVVLSQDTPSGYQAQPGATVSVTVSSGPPPVSQSPKPKGVRPTNRLEVKVPEVEVPEIETPEVKVQGVKIPSVKVP